jgi:hypothetical protein
MIPITMRLSALIILCLLLACSTQPENEIVLSNSLDASSNEELATGYVYHDKNENRTMDSDESGIHGVFVSNGVDLVQTDSEGKYSLPVSDDAIIFVIKPRNWMTPVNELNLPQFFYLHKPNGYPENFIFPGVEPTGPLPESINFPLYKDDDSSEFKMIVFGDPQPYNIEQIDFLADDIIRELVDKDGLEFGITMGDIVGDDLELFSPLNQAVSKIGIPWYNVLGNHDVNFQADSDELSDETFERVFGPPNYAFVYGDVHFIVVDDVIMNAPVGDRGYVGGLRPDQFEFVKNYLSVVPKEDLIVLNMHIPLVEHERFRESDQKELFDLLKDFPHTLSISAHTHTNNNTFFHDGSSNWEGEVPHHHFNVGTTSGSWWNGLRDEDDIPHTMMRDGTPNGYSFINFKGNEYIIDWKVAGSPESHQMNIHIPRGIVANSSDTTLLTVNFFNGSEQSELSYRILGQTDWQSMVKVDKPDPYYSMIYERYQNFMTMNFPEIWDNNEDLADAQYPLSRRFSRPTNSTHIWEANIGTDWPEGRHVIEVQAKDRYGRTFTEFHTMRVASN